MQGHYMKISELLPVVREYKNITDSTYECWEKAAKPIGNCLISEVDPTFVNLYWRSQLAPVGPCSAATVVRRLTLLSGIWATALKKQIIDGVNWWHGASGDLNYVADDCEERYEHRPWDFYAKYHKDPIFLGLWYHGMRVGELCGLLPNEIVFGASIPYFDIKNNSIRRVKPGSKRQVPIHPDFYHMTQHLEPQYRDNPGKNWSQVFSRSLHLEKGEAAHSIRHRFHSTLRALEIPDALLDRLVGHKCKSMSDKYGIWKMEHKLKWIKKIDKT